MYYALLESVYIRYIYAHCTNCTHFFSIGIPDVPNIATGSPICTKILVYP